MTVARVIAIDRLNPVAKVKKSDSKRDPFQAHSCWTGTGIANERATKSITQLAI